MTTNTAPLTAHALCDHPVTKAARAKCRKDRGAAWVLAAAARATKPAPKIEIEPCTCKRRSGFTSHTDGVWVCADCDRPTAGFITNAMDANVAA
jgi:hypothetical protein